MTPMLALVEFRTRILKGRDDWHLVIANTFEYIEFGFVSWFFGELVPLVAPFSLARFEPVGEIGDSMTGDAFK